MNGFDSSLASDSWNQRFAEGRVRSSPRKATWRDCRVDLVEQVPPQPEYIRTEQGSCYGIILFTSEVTRAEDRLEGGPRHYQGASPGDLHLYSRSRNEQAHLSRWHEPISFVSVRLAPSVVQTACQSAGLDPDAITIESRFHVDDPFLRQLTMQFGRVLSTSNSENIGPSLYPYVDQLTHTLSAHLVQHYTARPLDDRAITAGASEAGLPPDRLRRAQAYVESHLDQELTVEDLAAAACYSEYHFSRAFKRSTGRSPYQYVIQRRMEVAARRLRSNPHESVATVARAVGYASASQFSRQFKKHHGIPPSRYQREARR
jgi:AraC family transcriptional regulator